MYVNQIPSPNVPAIEAFSGRCPKEVHVHPGTDTHNNNRTNALKIFQYDFGLCRHKSKV